MPHIIRRIQKLAIVLPGLLVLMLAGATTAHAYTVRGVKWADATATYLIDGDFSAQGAGWNGAASNAVSAWNGVSYSPFAFGYSGGGPNHVNTGNLGQCGGPLLASTSLNWDGNNHFTNFTVTMNLGCGTAFWDGTQGRSIPANYYDLRSVMLHELGHALGLCHSGAAGLLMHTNISPGAIYSNQGDAADGDAWIYNPNFVNPAPEGGCIP